MPAQHACASCGHNLSRHRPIFDQDYRFFILVCPRCRFACVPRTNERLRRLRTCTRRIMTAMSALARSVLVLIFIIASVGLITNLMEDLKSTGLRPMDIWTFGRDAPPSNWEAFVANFGRTRLAVLLICGVASGTATIGLFKHARWWVAPAVFVALVTIALFIRALIDIQVGDALDFFDGSRPFRQMALNAFTAYLQLASLLFLAMLIAIPLGNTLARSLIKRRTRTWTRLLRNQRQSRSEAA